MNTEWLRVLSLNDFKELKRFIIQSLKHQTSSPHAVQLKVVANCCMKLVLYNMINSYSDTDKETPLPTDDFKLLRLSGLDKTEAELQRILEDSQLMILMNNNTLISNSSKAVWQWEVTKDSVHSVRCVLRSEEGTISDIKSFEDGVHFLTIQNCYDLNSRLLSIYSIETCTVLYKLSIDINCESLIPISIHHIFAFDQFNKSCNSYVYSTRRPGHKYLMTFLNDHEYLDAKKLLDIDNVVVFLYHKSLDLWNITEERCYHMRHYEFKIIKETFGMQVTTSHIIVSTPSSGIFLLDLKNLDIVSEELLIIPHAYCFWQYPISNSSIMYVEKKNSRSNHYEYIDYFFFQNLSKKLSWKAATLSRGATFSILHFFLPDLNCIAIFTLCGRFYLSEIDQVRVKYLMYGELIKNARILSQAHRTMSGIFKTIPVEICIKIISLTDLSISEQKAKSIASLYFCKPFEYPTLDYMTCKNGV